MPGCWLTSSSPTRRIAVASMVGTTVEFYDFYIYATAAVSVFPHLFFPKGNGTTALLASLATFGRRSWRGRWGRCCSGISAIAPDERPRSWARC